jgi:hypothetical protein
MGHMLMILQKKNGQNRKPCDNKLTTIFLNILSSNPNIIKSPCQYFIVGKLY